MVPFPGIPRLVGPLDYRWDPVRLALFHERLHMRHVGEVPGQIRGQETHDRDDPAVEENLVTGSTTGIKFAFVGNFYANNRAADNTTNYGGSLPVGAGDGGGNVSF